MPSRNAPPHRPAGADRRPRSPRADRSVPAVSPFDLSGRVALVTGASRGLGAAMAHALSRAGADLILWARDARSLHRQAQAIAARGRRALAQPVDVTDGASVRRAVRAALRRFDRIDILVNNAGIWAGRRRVACPAARGTASSQQTSPASSSSARLSCPP